MFIVFESKQLSLFVCLSIHRFIDIRVNKKCTDTVSAVMFSPAAIGANRVKAHKNFVSQYLLKWKATGGTKFGPAFAEAAGLVQKEETTVIVFLTDGEAGRDNAESVIGDLKRQMGDLLSLFCITLGPNANGNNEVVQYICNAGKGKMVASLNGDELGKTFSSIAKQMNSGAFGAL